MMESTYKSLISSGIKIKVSSTLDNSVGKKNIIDDNLETCWTSQQGLPQYIQLVFPELVIPKSISLTFQGGFVGTRCSVDVLASSEGAKWKSFTRIYPEDVNRRQTFDLVPHDLSSDPTTEGVKAIKVVFEESSDFFGRITVYDLKLEGVAL
ncbi:hypothetical protein SERLA73DRAFT_189390 [Serpula lacrymans var. lacrymans S7.3]|uniref:F5/8 type C domain-containing protein n=2 Tax=Serpula lacrymans var. lacrymans TaxID=341189 RepID=F8QDI5_SERL3|nr:uncharacterized protein SERLADRAFT_480184 [Serpula lacrymans var. lacrymans S7.9]EGN93656.1 hypothetical protein SERLA73DRAFT_189390 [Serpula lacrymans var. lacrymans S7.3]EGO19033.1 hypothetical protein SERLADRAFT_480184 [Serpula lacrymans var. lacrymans S7.9]